MKKYVTISGLISIVCFLPIANAGDLFLGFRPLAGKWTSADCAAAPGLAISLTETRGNAINVYRTDAQGKRTSLRLSTSPLLRKTGELKMVSEAFQNEVLQIEGVDASKQPVSIKISATDSDQLDYRETASATQASGANHWINCTYKRAAKK